MPSAACALRYSSTAGCSIALVTTCGGGAPLAPEAALAARAAPTAAAMAQLSLSVPHEVKLARGAGGPRQRRAQPERSWRPERERGRSRAAAAAAAPPPRALYLVRLRADEVRHAPPRQRHGRLALRRRGGVRRAASGPLCTCPSFAAAARTGSANAWPLDGLPKCSNRKGAISAATCGGQARQRTPRQRTPHHGVVSRSARCSACQPTLPTRAHWRAPPGRWASWRCNPSICSSGVWRPAGARPRRWRRRAWDPAPWRG
jgi:hypothetical protein